MLKNKLIAGSAALVSLAVAGAAQAGQPEPWQVRMQTPATAIMEYVVWLEEYTLSFIIPITLLVMLLLLWCMIRYRARPGREPSRTSHNTTIEVIWTLGPVIILLFLAVPSFQLLTAQYSPPEDPALTIKATGNQ